MRRLTALAVALAMSLTLIGAAVAQEPAPALEQPAPQQQPAAQPPAAEQPAPQQPAPQVQPPPAVAPALPEQAVLVRLKFKPGEAMRYRLHADAGGTVRVDMPLPPQMKAQVPPEIPFRAVVQGEAIAKVLRVDAAGGARLTLRADNLSLKGEALAHRIDMATKAGKYTVAVDGQRVESGKIPVGRGKQKIPVLQEPVEIKLGSRGQMLDLAIPGLGSLAKMLPGMSMQQIMKDQILLPEQPITAGQPWEQTQTVIVPGTNTPQTTNIRVTLNGIENWGGGRKIANLRVESVTALHDLDLGQAMAAIPGAGAGAPPMSGTVSGDAQIGGTMLFDITRGVMVRFDFQLTEQFSMRMSMDLPQQGPQNMAFDIQVTVKGALAKI